MFYKCQSQNDDSHLFVLNHVLKNAIFSAILVNKYIKVNCFVKFLCYINWFTLIIKRNDLDFKERENEFSKIVLQLCKFICKSTKNGKILKMFT